MGWWAEGTREERNEALTGRAEWIKAVPCS